MKCLVFLLFFLHISVYNAFNVVCLIFFLNWMRSSRICGWSSRVQVRASDCQCQIATVLGSIPASSDTVKSEGRQIKQCWIQYMKKKNLPSHNKDIKAVSLVGQSKIPDNLSNCHTSAPYCCRNKCTVSIRPQRIMYYTVRIYRRKIRLIESNAKWCYLKQLTVKGLCGRCFIFWGPLLSYDPRLHTPPPPLHTLLYTCIMFTVFFLYLFT